ncbi:MAG: nucleoid-associated protein YejK [Plesiomonas sp.]|uniref:nucleoid-associated protein YejK n=1 Tax=Plesiomonas sp. TaxID=2486279 RepID=UPI003F376CDB
MSLKVNHIALHQLVKRDENTLDIMLRDSPLPINDAVEQMMEELHRVYSAKAGKAYGLFNSESIFAQTLQNWVTEPADFLAFSRMATEQLRDQLAKYPFAESGVVVLCHYRYLASEYLLIAQLNNCVSMRVNELLDVSTTHYLDITHLDIAARIDLTEWQSNPDSQRYLTFVKGRVGRKVSDFFMDFLGAAEGLDTKAQNRGLLQAVNDYCAEAQLDKEERQEYRQKVYAYCNEQLQAGDEIELKDLSNVLPEVAEQNFYQFAEQQDYALEESFPADRSTLRQLTKFTGSGGGISLSFDALLLGERIYWDATTDTLMIKGTPPNLRDQLQRRSTGK